MLLSAVNANQLACALGRDVALAAGWPVPLVLDAGQAIPVTADRVYVLANQTPPAAYTIAAPGADNIGRTLVLINVVNNPPPNQSVAFPANSLLDGVSAGGNSNWDSAIEGASLTVIAIDATRWAVIVNNAGTIT